MIKADFKDRKLVVDILVEAFEPLDDDNSINFVVKQDDRRLERMRILMGYLFDKAMDSGEVFLSDNRASCLLINYAHKEQFTLRGLLSMLRLAFKCIGVERVAKVLKRQRMVKRNYPKTDHIRPMIFAVKNEFKGGATAPRLITQVFEEFKKNTLPVIVDATSEHNVRLYQKFGLNVVNTEEALGFPIYLLRMN